ncbi:beta-lactamase class C [Amycolatopsis mediterranei S699]|uniref:Beta-lactamase class C n=3 Tax=Amycolatopsis mediterranei TaxID=33910 RepID=A0A0H3D5B6_AMYMU|nr:serine hydrolase domain-containing protein [Amycolatopsis mediterranei]ADJ45831.1 beta-lactamase class C [Amycolatopsis mediterranei U32]AEK42612.1 beta-lactamase class C [Amycolatopsis mediterranei S699]AFO77542.1 beta-lactamase class C [Amycolatopsis mediterranei S699]AGT84670.1 beta-lactamase class C [Amycolatopsis mediterranei RB]KDO05366.1 beta-lactamase [Amycolatopsis mediterranei]
MTTTRRSVLGLLGASGALLATGAVAGAASGTTLSSTSVDVRAFDRFVREQAAADAFSGSLLLVHRGRPVLARSYGRANDAAPNGPDTRFAMASVTKLFTAVAIAQLAQAGKIAYTSTLGTFLSGFPAEIADTVQVHHLLTHTSGLGDTFTMPGYLEEALTWTDADQVMTGTTDYIRRTSLEFAPGAGSRYSNAAYHLLGAIVAQVSGTSYYDYVREHVFRPAGMTATDFYTRPQWHTDPRIAHPYAKQPSGGRTDTIDQRLYVGTPAGDAFATCADMANFAAALQGSKLLDRAFTGITLNGKVPPPPQPGPPPPGGTPGAPHAVFQCYGPVTLLVGGQWVTGHGGGAPGTSTDFQMYPDTGWVTVILSNYDYDGGPSPVVKKARDLITA